MTKSNLLFENRKTKETLHLSVTIPHKKSTFDIGRNTHSEKEGEYCVFYETSTKLYFRNNIILFNPVFLSGLTNWNLVEQIAPSGQFTAYFTLFTQGYVLRLNNDGVIKNKKPMLVTKKKQFSVTFYCSDKHRLIMAGRKCLSEFFKAPFVHDDHMLDRREDNRVLQRKSLAPRNNRYNFKKNKT